MKHYKPTLCLLSSFLVSILAHDQQVSTGILFNRRELPAVRREALAWNEASKRTFIHEADGDAESHSRKERRSCPPAAAEKHPLSSVDLSAQENESFYTHEKACNKSQCSRSEGLLGDSRRERLRFKKRSSTTTGQPDALVMERLKDTVPHESSSLAPVPGNDRHKKLFGRTPGDTDHVVVCPPLDQWLASYPQARYRQLDQNIRVAAYTSARDDCLNRCVCSVSIRDPSLGLEITCPGVESQIRGTRSRQCRTQGCQCVAVLRQDKDSGGPSVEAGLRELSSLKDLEQSRQRKEASGYKDSDPAFYRGGGSGTANILPDKLNQLNPYIPPLARFTSSDAKGSYWLHGPTNRALKLAMSSAGLVHAFDRPVRSYPGLKKREEADGRVAKESKIRKKTKLTKRTPPGIGVVQCLTIQELRERNPTGRQVPSAEHRRRTNACREECLCSEVDSSPGTFKMNCRAASKQGRTRRTNSCAQVCWCVFVQKKDPDRKLPPIRNFFYELGSDRAQGVDFSQLASNQPGHSGYSGPSGPPQNFESLHGHVRMMVGWTKERYDLLGPVAMEFSNFLLGEVPKPVFGEFASVGLQKRGKDGLSEKCLIKD